MSNPLAIVTGATGGLGSALVAHLVAHDYQVIACGRTMAKCVALMHEYRRDQVVGYCFDFAQPEGLASHFAALSSMIVEQGGVLSLLVCAHGAKPYREPLEYVSPAIMDEVYRIDASGSFSMAQYAFTHMREHHDGAMVFVSSAHAYATYPSRVPYGMAKSAVLGMVRGLALDLGPYNIRVNSVSPWQVMSSRSTAIAGQEGEDTFELYRQRSPMRRLVSPADVAKMVLAVADNESMTGQDVRLDCGVGASMWHRGFFGQERA